MLHQHGNTKDILSGSEELQVGDIVLILSEGMLDNIPLGFIAPKIQFGGRQDVNRAKMLVKIASQVSLGITVTPFANAAAEAGFLWEGGRPGDTSAIVLSIVPRGMFGGQRPRLTQHMNRPQASENVLF